MTDTKLKGIVLITLGFVLLTFTLDLRGQITGSVVGVVQDTSGAMVAGATVTLTNIETNLSQTTVTSSSGDFRFPLVPVGQYEITAQMSGFKTAKLTNLTVLLGQTTRTELVVEVGELAQEVKVSGRIDTLQTESGAVQGSVYHEDIVNLPLNGRNFVQLVALQPNAVPSPRTSFFRNLGGYNVIAGAPVEATAVTIDGINIRDLNDPRITISPNPDVIQEFQEAQSNYSAAQGLGAGAQVNLVTKAGTNAFHGTVFEFLRNDKFDARNFFSTGQKPAFRQNQFGFSFGGPIKKDKTFFFTGYEGLRIRKKETFLYTVPTIAQRNGDFSADPPIFDPLNVDPNTGQRAPFAGNMIPSSRFSPEAVNALNLLYLPPNLPGNFNNLIGNPPDNSTNDQFSVRIDHKFGASDSLFGRYIYYNYRRITGIFTSFPNFADNFNTPSQNVAIVYPHVFGPHTVNQFRVGYHRMTQVIEDVDINVPINQQIGITGTSTIFLGNPSINIAGFGISAAGFAVGGTGGISNAPNNRSDNGYYLYDDLTHTMGRHTLGAGFTLALEQINGGINAFARGLFSFAPTYTAQIGVPGTGSAAADFLLGFPSFSGRGLGIGFRNFRQRRWGAYFTDDWKVSDVLTLNLGLRWEFFEPAYEKSNHLSGFDPETGTIILAGAGGVPKGLRVSRYKDFQPRVGFAYRIPDYKMVVRGGYGIYFMPMTTFPTPFLNLLNEPFFTLQFFFGDPITPNLTLADAFPSGLGVSSTSLFSLNKNFRDPYLQQWNFAVQREITSSLLIELGYVGNKGTQLRNAQNINAPPAGPGDLQSRRPFPAFSTITSYENIGKSNYHAGYVKADKRFAGGLGFVASYTWAKLIDVGGIVQPGDLDDTLGRDPLNPNAERGRSFFDARHRFVASYVWQVPVGKGHAIGGNWSGWLQQVVGNWQLNGILTLQSGLPITPVLAFDNSNTGLFTDRPDVIGDPNDAPRSPSQWFNTSAFVLPPAFSYGNAGRNIINGPPIKQFDFSIFKHINLTEELVLQFRTEFFNFTNHPNFDPPGTVFGTPSFGVIGSAGEARQIQFGLKFLF